MTIEPNLFENLRMELRRGSLILAVLAQLRTEQYGYTLRKPSPSTAWSSTKYFVSLLRRLESQGLLVSEWAKKTSATSASIFSLQTAKLCSSNSSRNGKASTLP